MSTPSVATGPWETADRLRISGIVAVVALLHVLGWSLYLYHAATPAAAGSFAGAGMLAYTLGIRHAFDADHIAAIDDTTRLMLQRGRRPVGVGFFFAMGHSTVVMVLALVVALAASAAGPDLDTFREVGGVVSQATAATFLLLVAALNAVVLVGVLRLWAGMVDGSLAPEELERQLLNRGLLNRMLGARARTLISSSWHMYPVGILFGLGLETASEVTLLALSGSAASQGGLPILGVLALPLLFAAGMSACDTADSLLMTRAYGWAYRHPARRLYYNAAMTAMTVVVAAFVGTVYLAHLLLPDSGRGGLLGGYARLADHFQLLGFGIVAVFVLTWLVAAAAWRLGGFSRRYDS